MGIEVKRETRRRELTTNGRVRKHYFADHLIGICDALNWLLCEAHYKSYFVLL